MASRKNDTGFFYYSEENYRIVFAALDKRILSDNAHFVVSHIGVSECTNKNVTVIDPFVLGPRITYACPSFDRKTVQAGLIGMMMMMFIFL